MLGRVSGAGIQAPAHHRHEGVVGQSLPISVPQFPHLSLLLCVQKGVGWWGKSQKVLLKPAPPPPALSQAWCAVCWGCGSRALSLGGLASETYWLRALGPEFLQGVGREGSLCSCDRDPSRPLPSVWAFAQTMWLPWLVGASSRISASILRDSKWPRKGLSDPSARAARRSCCAQAVLWGARQAFISQGTWAHVRASTSSCHAAQASRGPS